MSQRPGYCIGWDVGGWNCDKNRASRDAIAILDSGRRIVGKPWRGNLAKHIYEAKTSDEWIDKLFGLCNAVLASKGVDITLAVDTPLGFSDAFVDLVASRRATEPSTISGDNAYLFRGTERWLYEQGLHPLSPVKDMIGSQATKGMHVLAKFAPISCGCGVWTDGGNFEAIESYPSVCRNHPDILGLLKDQPELNHPDLRDALVCALVAYLFAASPEALVPPIEGTSINEGWIWVPSLHKDHSQ